ncbi:hypothetical protein WJX72_011123 [[Myrmecia] bisecta]|uniref:RRM domain-containing protein n=1 Tax=[Myrmecia] bisecta TaxID=41462 RepID=A0AAW1QSL3_9CHLO
MRATQRAGAMSVSATAEVLSPEAKATGATNEDVPQFESLSAPAVAQLTENGGSGAQQAATEAGRALAQQQVAEAAATSDIAQAAMAGARDGATSAATRAIAEAGMRHQRPAGRIANDGSVPLSRVLRLANMVEREDLCDEDEYADILDDVTCELTTKYGPLASVVIPRPAADPTDDPPAVGLVFVEFQREEGAIKAQAALNGRTFGPNKVQASFYDPVMFRAGQHI